VTPIKRRQNSECRFSFRFASRSKRGYLRWDDTGVPWDRLDDDGMTEAEDDSDDDDDDDDDDLD
jgi:hypothetical protein